MTGTIGQEDDLFYNALAIDRFMEGFFRGRDLSTNKTQFFRLMRMGILDGREGYDMPMTVSTRAMRHTAAVSARLRSITRIVMLIITGPSTVLVK